MENDQLINEINKNMAIDFPGGLTLHELHQRLGILINHLIQTDFQKLVSILYWIDVSEGKLKQLLQTQPHEDAGKIIAALLIERQLQKINSRHLYKRTDENFDEEEKW